MAKSKRNTELPVYDYSGLLPTDVLEKYRFDIDPAYPVQHFGGFGEIDFRTLDLEGAERLEKRGFPHIYKATSED